MPTDSAADLAVADAHLAPYSDGRIWDEGVVVREICAYAEQSIICAYEAGRRLIWTKEVLLGHGEFGEWCAKNLPFDGRTARRYMQLAEFLVANPRLLKPAAKAGLTKTLLLTTLSPDQIERIVEDGHVAQASIDELDTVPYWKLKQDLDALKKKTGTTEAQLAAKEKELARTKEVVADLSGALDVDDADQIARINKVRDNLTNTVTGAHAQLVSLGDRMFRGELSPRVAAELVGVLEYMEVLVRNTVLQARARIGEGHWQDAITENIEAARCAAESNPIPDRLLPAGARRSRVVEHGDEQ